MYDEYTPTRQERREARRQPKMPVNGKSVFLLQDLGRKPKKRRKGHRDHPRGR